MKNEIIHDGIISLFEIHQTLLKLGYTLASMNIGGDGYGDARVCFTINVPEGGHFGVQFPMKLLDHRDYVVHSTTEIIDAGVSLNGNPTEDPYAKDDWAWAKKEWAKIVEKVHTEEIQRFLRLQRNSVTEIF